jgi:thymidylate synthase
MSISIIVAIDENNGIGKNGKIPWKCPEDIKYFKKITNGNAVIMGRKTFDSINNIPLSNRLNIVISRQEKQEKEGVVFCNSLEESIEYSNELSCENIFIIGGEEIYKLALTYLKIDKIYLTRIKGNYDCDKFFKLDTENWNLIEKKEEENCSFLVFEKNENEEEIQYLNLLSNIIKNGKTVKDRTGTGTIKLNGNMMRFTLSNNTIPLITTKKVYWNSIVKELLWFIRGDTNTLNLEKDGVNIWKQNSTRQFLDNRGLKDNKVGDIGPGYGFQFRFSGAEYKGCHKSINEYGNLIDYTGKGFDQLNFCINEIKTNPTSRRILINLYNIKDIDKMALPPCHYSYQFFVDDDELSCMIILRSNDMMLGAPFNIASASLLTHMIAYLCKLRARELIYVSGDTHIYLDHIDGAKEQIRRIPYKFPTLKINCGEEINTIDDFKFEHFVLKDYKYHEKIKLNMST